MIQFVNLRTNFFSFLSFLPKIHTFKGGIKQLKVHIDEQHKTSTVFSSQGCVKEHRLWVSSSKDEPPYPLMGEPTC